MRRAIDRDTQNTSSFIAQSSIGRGMATIASLKTNSSATIEGTITAISPPRRVTTQRGETEVADATLQDESGTVQWTLWGEEIKQYHVGQKIKISDGWVKEFRGKLQVSKGRGGTVTVQSK